LIQFSTFATLIVSLHTFCTILFLINTIVVPQSGKQLLHSCTSPELLLSHEEPIEEDLHFLDLRSNVSNGLCWEYGKLEPKPLLPYQSSHSKLVKRGVVTSLPNNAIKKSCVHRVDAAIKYQQTRFKNAGYKANVVESVTRKMLMRFQGLPRTEKVRLEKVACIPFFHGFFYNLLAVGRTFGLEVVFTTVFKLGSLTPFSEGIPSPQCPSL
ncbi:unnamed protein product, partial [Ixodes persulcatus]